MKTLKESLLDDIENTMAAGDKMIKDYKKAVKHWQKLITKTTGKSTGQFCVVAIKSPELVEYIGCNIPEYQQFVKYNQGLVKPHIINEVAIVYDIDDVFDGKHTRRLQINLQGKSSSGRLLTVIGSHVYYTEDNENISNPKKLDEGVGIKEAVDILSQEFTRKYKTLDDVVTAVKNNVKYTVKI